MLLRPYQKQALESVCAQYAQGVKRQLIAMPTGSGKTVVFANLPSRLPLNGQMLVLAHRDELLEQAAEKIRHWNPDLSISIEQADQYADPEADVIIASVATLGRKVSKRRERFDWSHITKLVVDEAHHATASTYRIVIDEFQRAGGNRLLLGVTATPNRSDGTPLAEVFDQIVFTYSMRQAITDGWLCDVIGMRVDTDTSLDSVHTVAGDFNQGELAETVNNPERNQLVVKTWLENAADRQTIVFTVDIQHAVDLAALFQAYGVKCEAVWGTDSQRAEKIERHKRGVTTVLANCGVLTEGYDDPTVSCILLARPTKSTLLFQQMIGRGTRLCEGKSNCLVIDVVDTTSRHSLATLPSLLGMPQNLNLRGESAVGVMQLLEEAQREHPNIDLSRLTDIDQLTAFIEQVDLWRTVEFAPEIVEHSNNSWHRSVDGGFVLMLPDRQKVAIARNILGKWEISGMVNDKLVSGLTDTLAEALKTADEFLARNTNYAQLVRREAKWKDKPATEKQIATVQKLYKGKPIPASLTKGEADNLIQAAIAQFKPRAPYMQRKVSVRV